MLSLVNSQFLLYTNPMKLTKKEIIQQLKNEILHLQLEPGTMLSEAMLTERFNLSRTPIRDVLKQLELEGYVNIIPQKGTIVSHIDLNSVEQIIYMRKAVETQVFMDLKSQITLQTSLKLTHILKEQRSCIQDNRNVTDFLIYDDAFHKTCFEAIGREALWDVMQQFNVHYLRYRLLHMENGRRLDIIIEEHEKILACLQGSNDFTMAELIGYHLRSDRITDELAKYVDLT